MGLDYYSRIQIKPLVDPKGMLLHKNQCRYGCEKKTLYFFVYIYCLFGHLHIKLLW